MRRPLDAQIPQVIETDGDSAAGLSEGYVQINAQAGDGRLLDRLRSVGRQRRQALLRLRQCAGQELAFRPVQLEREGQLMPPLPAILRQQGRASSQISER